MSAWFRAAAFIGVVTFLVTYLSLGLQQASDPLTRLAVRALTIVPAQIGMPKGPPSALPKTQARLDLAVRRLNATVEYTVLPENHYGSANHDSRLIVINEKLNADMRTATLAHELAHLIQPPGLNKYEVGEREVWADSVAYLVIREEDDRLMDSASYLAWHKASLNILQVYRKEILFAASLLRGEVE
jgi:hypothetical protein